MRIWLIGAAPGSIEILRQLVKNEEIDIIISDSKADPAAVREGIIEKVNYVEIVSPVNVNTLARRIQPDLIIIDSTAEGRHLGRVTGGSAFSQALTYEIANVSDYPCLVL